MPTVRISKIKVRRGSDNQRKFEVFDQGELIYTVDTKRLFIGTGTLSGGSVVGSKIHPILNNYYSLSTLKSEVGDMVNVNNIYYQLTASDYTNINSWANLATKINTNIFNYDTSNRIDLNVESISAKYIKPSTVGNGIKVEDGIIQSNYNTRNFEISASQITIRPNSIDENDISSNTLSRGLTGGSGDKITIDIDPNFFTFNGNQLSLSALPALDLKFSNLSASWFGHGLIYDDGNQIIYSNLTDVADSSLSRNLTGGIYINPSVFGAGLVYDTLSSNKLSTNLVDVDNYSIVKDLTGGISINNNALSGSNQWAKISVDQFGRVTDNVSSIYGTLTGNSALSSLNLTNTLSSIFNGTPSQTLSGGVPGLKITQFTATDITGYTVTLSSAGFITFEGPTTTRNGSKVGRFAIPIFAY